MSAKRYTPTITKQEFDQIGSSLRTALKKKFDESKADADRPKPNPATQGAFDHVPELDSKTVARWSSVVKDYIGCKLDPRLIRKGGYDSFDEFWADMAPKIRNSCQDGPSPSSETVTEAHR